jgi:hypothetical protein
MHKGQGVDHDTQPEGVKEEGDREPLTPKADADEIFKISNDVNQSSESRRPAKRRRSEEK